MSKNVETQIAVVLTKLEYIGNDLAELKHNVEGKYTTKDEFQPVKRIVYGMVTLILAAVVTAVLALVVRGGV